MFSTGTVVRVVGQREVEAKLLAAAPRILEQNKLMVTAMLNQIKPMVVAQTPFGPAHFGYHGRDTLRVEVKAEGFKTVGTLRAARQLYWREYGTGSRFRGSKQMNALRGYLKALGGSIGTGGEPATMTAHKTASGLKRTR